MEKILFIISILISTISFSQEDSITQDSITQDSLTQDSIAREAISNADSLSIDEYQSVYVDGNLSMIVNYDGDLYFTFTYDEAVDIDKVYRMYGILTEIVEKQEEGTSYYINVIDNLRNENSLIKRRYVNVKESLTKKNEELEKLYRIISKHEEEQALSKREVKNLDNQVDYLKDENKKLKKDKKLIGGGAIAIIIAILLL